MWDNPHEGIAVLNLLGKQWGMKFDWAAMARVEYRYEGSEDLNNPKDLAQIAAQGLEALHPGEVTAEAIMKARLPLMVLGERVKSALSYATGSHPYLVTLKKDEAEEEDEGEVEPRVRGAQRITRAYKIALRVGIDAEQFWRLTPYQTAIRAEVFGEVHKDNIRNELWKAWHTGMFARDDYKLPKYESLFPPPMPKVPKKETPREMAIRLRNHLMAAYPPKSGMKTNA